MKFDGKGLITMKTKHWLSSLSITGCLCWFVMLAPTLLSQTLEKPRDLSEKTECMVTIRYFNCYYPGDTRATDLLQRSYEFKGKFSDGVFTGINESIFWDGDLRISGTVAVEYDSQTDLATTVTLKLKETYRYTRWDGSPYYSYTNIYVTLRDLPYLQQSSYYSWGLNGEDCDQYVGMFNYELITINDRRSIDRFESDSWTELEVYFEGPDPSTLADNVEIDKITPEPDDGFPTVTENNTAEFTEIDVTYDLQTADNADLYLIVFGNEDPEILLGDATKEIVKNDPGVLGLVTFDKLTAYNVTEEILTLSVVAFINPNGTNEITDFSDILLYEIKDYVEIQSTDPNPQEIITAKTPFNLTADLKYELNSSETGTLELQIKDLHGDLVHPPPVESITSDGEETQLQSSFIIPDHTNVLRVTGLLTSDHGKETRSDPPIEFKVNRAKFVAVDPPKEQTLDANSDQAFTATIDYHIGIETETGALFLDLYDTFWDPITAPASITNNKMFNLKTGGARVTLNTFGKIPHEMPRVHLVVTLLDMPLGLPIEITSDTMTFQIGLMGTVGIFGANPMMPLSLAEVTAYDGTGKVIDDDRTDPEGNYRLILDYGDYTIVAQADVPDRGIRVEEKTEFTVDESTLKVPRFRLGVVNRGPEVMSLATKWKGFGVFGILEGGTSTQPYSTVMDQIHTFAQSQPAFPEPTDERLYRLYLATKTVGYFAEGASDLNGQLSSNYIDILGAIAGLADLNNVVGNTVTFLLKKLGNYVSGKFLIKAIQLEYYLKRFSKRFTKYLQKMQQWVFDYMKARFNKQSTKSTVFIEMIQKAIGQVAQRSSWVEGSYGGAAGETLESGVKYYLGNYMLDRLNGIYAYTTLPSVNKAYQTALGFSPANDKLRDDQTDVHNRIAKTNNRNNNLTQLLENSYWSSFLTFSGSLRTYIQATVEILEPVEGAEWNISPHVKKLVLTLKAIDKAISTLQIVMRSINVHFLVDRVFEDMPNELQEGVNMAFHKHASQVTPKQRAPLGNASNQGQLNDKIMDDLNDSVTDYQNAVQQTQQLIEGKELQLLLDHMTGSLIDADEALDIAIRSAEAPIIESAGLAFEADSTLEENFYQMADSTMTAETHRIRFLTQLFSFYFDALTLESLDDPAYTTGADSLFTIMSLAAESQVWLMNQIETVGEEIGNAGGILPTAMIQSALITSNGDTVTVIQSSPMDMTVSVTVSNLTDQPLANLTLRITDFPTDFDVDVLSVEEFVIPQLNSDTPQTFNWNVRYNGSLSRYFIPIAFELESAEGEPFIYDHHRIDVLIHDAQDDDEDLLSNNYESYYNIEPNRWNPNDDADEDGLTNLAEFLLRTIPTEDDTDNDGHKDGDEVISGSDPLDPQSTPMVPVQAVGVRIDDHSATGGTELVVPIHVGDLMGHDIYALDIKLGYNQSVLEARDVSNTATVTAGWGNPTFEVKENGQIWLAMAGSNPLPGSGVLCNITFYVAGSQLDTSFVRFLECVLNEGVPATQTQNGLVTVTSGSGIGEENAGQPDKILLLQNYPNPFNPTTTIAYSIPKASHVKLEIYTLTGAKIKTLEIGQKRPGFYTVQWDTRDEKGLLVSGGLYLYRLQIESHVEVKKMLLVR